MNPTETEDAMLAGVAKAIEELADAGQPAVGHFEVLDVAGKKARHMSILTGHEVDDLFALPDYEVAQLFALLGNEVRLAILRELIEGPKVVTDIVAKLNMQTTGQAYHHLKELAGGGFCQQRDGKYHVSMKVARIYVAALALAWNAGIRLKTDEEEIR